MKYAYEITYNNGYQEWNIQHYCYTEEQMLEAFKKHGVVKVRFHRHIPNGYHLCGCGNLVKGTNEDLLCDECRAIYGHKYTYEL